MLSPKELVEQYPEILEDVMAQFHMSEDQTAAFEHITPMTQEIFESCFDTLMSVDAIQTCMKLMEEYPEFTDTMTKNIMDELGLTDDDIVPLSEEEAEAGIKAIKERIARETGKAI